MQCLAEQGSSLGLDEGARSQGGIASMSLRNGKLSLGFLLCFPVQPYTCPLAFETY